jgi:integrase
MVSKQPTPDPYKRHKTRYRGVTYRERADGTRTYFVFSGGSQHPVTGGESAALTLQAELRTTPKIVVASSVRFHSFSEEWFQAKAPRLRQRTANYHRRTLDLVLLPRFGSWKVSAIDADAVASLVRDLEREGLHAIDPKRPVRPLGHSSIDNYLKPLRGIMALALRRKLTPANPFEVLTADDRPKRAEKQPVHEWTDRELTALHSAAQQLARNPQSRFDYAPLIRITERLGLRLGEALGLRWEDFDRNTSTLTVCRQWLRTGEYGPTKTRAGVREIALPHALRDELIALRLRSEFSQETDPVFASRSGTPLGHRNVTRRGFEPARDLAGLPSDLTFHDLRHAAVSRMISVGLDAVTVAGVCGHENASITLKVYAHWFNRESKDEQVRAALA